MASNSSLTAPRMGLLWKTRIWGRGPLPDTPDLVSHHTRFSALHHAALGGSLELIALLLEAQATVDIKDSNGESPVCPHPRPCGQSLPLLRRSHANRCWHSFSELANASPLQSSQPSGVVGGTDIPLSR